MSLLNDAPDYVGETVVLLAHDSARHQEMGAAGKQAAKSEFNWELMSNKLTSIYKML